jgi:hypothetical protein
MGYLRSTRDLSDNVLLVHARNILLPGQILPLSHLGPNDMYLDCAETRHCLKTALGLLLLCEASGALSHLRYRERVSIEGQSCITFVGRRGFGNVAVPRLCITGRYPVCRVDQVNVDCRSIGDSR